ncbi:MAG: DUF1573 domain-containing protein [Acidobacteriota bacterium]
MKSIFISLIIMVVAMAVYAGPEITFEKEKIDFGEITSGKVVDLEYTFENTGDDTLIIKNINTSCGCTYTRLEKKEYEPGEKGVIPVKFFSKGYRGKVIKSVTVVSNVKANPYVRLSLSGLIKLKDFSVAEVDKDLLDFGEVKINKTSSKEVIIKNTGNIDLRILEVTHSPEVSTVFTKKIIKSGETGLLTVTFNPLQVGQFSTFLRVRTNAFKSPLLIIRLKTDIKEGVTE